MKRLTLIVILLFPHVVSAAEEYRCQVELSYTWEKTVAGKSTLLKRALKKVQEQGISQDYIKTRLTRLASKFEEDALAACRGRHEGAELCLLDKLQGVSAKLHEMPLEKRQEVIAKAKEECLQSAGRCIKGEVSEVVCEVLAPQN